MLNRRTVTSITLIMLLAFSFMSPPQPVQAGALIRVSPTPSGEEFAPDEYNVNLGYCSLREAIVAANTNKAFGGCAAGNGADTIIIPAGTYLLTIAGSSEDNAKTGDLDIRDDTTLIGAGSGANGTLIIIDKTISDRVIEIIRPATRGISVTISNLGISSGFVASSNGGGGILNNGATVNLERVVISKNSASSSSVGGGITNLSGSKLTINNSTISSNSAGHGGGIYNGGKLIITNSLIFSNTAYIAGGGIDNVPIDTSIDTVSITNSTIALNMNQKGGGGIANSGPFTLINSTIVDNTGAGLFLNDNTMRVQNSIIARNRDGLNGPNCIIASGESAKLVSAGYNLVGENNSANECIFGTSTDLVKINDAGLLLASALGNNGGPTQTFKLLTDSPAIDKVPRSACPGTDQRGYIRPAGSLCDIGAYEGGAKPPDKKVFLPFAINQ